MRGGNVERPVRGRRCPRSPDVHVGSGKHEKATTKVARSTTFTSRKVAASGSAGRAKSKKAVIDRNIVTIKRGTHATTALYRPSM